MAEERRLCYVGMTRARKRLTLSLARCRSLFGELRFNPPSRFVRELPKELTEGLAALDRLSPMQERARKERPGTTSTSGRTTPTNLLSAVATACGSRRATSLPPSPR